jgi:hypothetical protein
MGVVVTWGVGLGVDVGKCPGVGVRVCLGVGVTFVVVAIFVAEGDIAGAIFLLKETIFEAMFIYKLKPIITIKRLEVATKI